MPPLSDSENLESSQGRISSKTKKPSITVILTALKPATMSKEVSTTKLNYFEVKFFTCTTDTTRTSDHPSEPPAAQKENHQHP